MAVSKCPVCRKRFPVLYPSIWAYRRGDSFFCSWTCLRAYDKKIGENEEMKKLTLDDKKRVVALALAGGDYIDFLESLGCKNPTSMFYTIKQGLKKADPDTYEKLEAKKKKTGPKPKKLELDAGGDYQLVVMEEKVNITEPVVIDEKMPINRPLVFDGMTVTEVQGELGKYRYDAVHNCIDFDGKDADSLGFTVDGWKAFMAELKHAAAILGVEL